METQNIKTKLIEKLIDQNEEVEEMLHIMGLDIETMVGEAFEHYLEVHETLVGLL
jgi:hypothetical protein